MLDRFEYRTPESLSVSQPVAGIGSRGLAALVDSGLILVIMLVLVAAALAISGFTLSVVPSGPVLIVIVVVASVVPVAYYVICELASGGRSVGKYMFGLRVVDRDGVPLSAGDSLVRNLVRIVDFLPVLYGVGVVAMFAGSRPRRLGDLAAGTVVIHDRGLRRLAQELGPGGAVRLGRTEPGLPLPGLERAGRFELALLDDFFSRTQLTPERRAQLATELVGALEKRTGIPLRDESGSGGLDALERLYLQLRWRLIGPGPESGPATPPA